MKSKTLGEIYVTYILSVELLLIFSLTYSISFYIYHMQVKDKNKLVLDNAKIFKYIWLGSYRPGEKEAFASGCVFFTATLETCVV